jgi:hypothetical protein
MYFTQEGIELSLTHTEQFDKLYPTGYLQSLQHLEQQKQCTTEVQFRLLADAVIALN